MREMMRFWIGKNNFYVALQIGMYDNSEVNELDAWGQILSDATRHVAKALALHTNKSQAETVDALFERLLANMEPSESDTGSFQQPN